MNVLLPPHPSFFPHQHDPNRRSPPRCSSPYTNMNRKRKADDDGNDEMSMSPMSSPAVQPRQIAPRPAKRTRNTEAVARQLPISRLLETLDNSQLRMVLQRICEHHPNIEEEVVTQAPRPTITSALQVLAEYRDKLVAAMPYGQSSSDYTYYRVKQPMMALVNAIIEFTPQFLPPLETQATLSLEYLDGATRIAHEVPEWDSQTYRHHKDDLYDELAKAWALVISEAAKRAGGFSLNAGGWDQILARHHGQSNGRLQPAMNALSEYAAWSDQSQQQTAAGSSAEGSILEQLMNNTYGAPVRVGPW